MFKGAKIMMVVIALLVGAYGVERGAMEREAYYRGVYETCVQSYVVNGQYTQFDVQVCKEFEQDARKAQWYEHALKRP